MHLASVRWINWCTYEGFFPTHPFGSHVGRPELCQQLKWPFNLWSFTLRSTTGPKCLIQYFPLLFLQVQYEMSLDWGTMTPGNSNIMVLVITYQTNCQPFWSIYSIITALGSDTVQFYKPSHTNLTWLSFSLPITKEWNVWTLLLIQKLKTVTSAMQTHRWPQTLLYIYSMVLALRTILFISFSGWQTELTWGPKQHHGPVPLEFLDKLCKY